MDSYLSRLATFFSFPFTSPVSTTCLAESGFHYTGNKDEVVCHRCLLRYSGWQRHDNPMDIHIKLSPCCTFVTSDRVSNGSSCDLFNGADGHFPHEVIGSKLNASLDDIASSSCQNNCPMTNGNSVTEFDVFYKIIFDSTEGNNAPEIEYSSNDPAVQSVMEMGYNKKTIAKAMRLFSERQGKTLDAQTLLTLVWEVEDNNGAVSDEEHSSRESEKVPDESHREVDKDRDNGVSSEENRVEDVVQLQEENRVLRDLLTCKVCLGEKASILFLPCGHLATCPMCASALWKCPICRTFIQGRVLTEL